MNARRIRDLIVLVLAGIAVGFCEEPLNVTVCQLKADPPAYNHRLVKVTGFVSHDFEDFSIYDPTCASWPSIWLEYGGKLKSDTTYCCGATAGRSRPEQLAVEDIPIPLRVDETFKSFDKAIQPPFRSGQHGSIVRATLVGRFFAGQLIQYPKTQQWGGYGHFGCCTLLAIQQVISADSQNRGDLDYGASVDQPTLNKVGCGYEYLLPYEQEAERSLKWQKDADDGQHDWAFDDPRRVALEALAKISKLDIGALSKLKLIREAQGRKVFQVEPTGSSAEYMVVVSRPYISSFYSRDPSRVAWVAVAAYKSSCVGKNAVSRAK